MRRNYLICPPTTRPLRPRTRPTNFLLRPHHYCLLPLIIPLLLPVALIKLSLTRQILRLSMSLLVLRWSILDLLYSRVLEVLVRDNSNLDSLQSLVKVVRLFLWPVSEVEFLLLLLVRARPVEDLKEPTFHKVSAPSMKTLEEKDHTLDLLKVRVKERNCPRIMMQVTIEVVELRWRLNRFWRGRGRLRGVFEDSITTIAEY